MKKKINKDSYENVCARLDGIVRAVLAILDFAQESPIDECTIRQVWSALGGVSVTVYKLKEQIKESLEISSGLPDDWDD